MSHVSHTCLLIAAPTERSSPLVLLHISLFGSLRRSSALRWCPSHTSELPFHSQGELGQLTSVVDTAQGDFRRSGVPKLARRHLGCVETIGVDVSESF